MIKRAILGYLLSIASASLTLTLIFYASPGGIDHVSVPRTVLGLVIFLAVLAVGGVLTLGIVGRHALDDSDRK